MEDMMQDDQKLTGPLATTKAADPAGDIKAPETNAKLDISDAIDRGVEAWFGKVGRNSPLSRNTAALNHVADSLPMLKETLNREFGK
jgi:hypothetical protein